MKSFGIILLALFAAYAGYQYAYPELAAWAKFEKTPEVIPGIVPEAAPETSHKSETKSAQVEPPDSQTGKATVGSEVTTDKPPTKEVENPPPGSNSTPEQPTVADTPPSQAESDEFKPPVFPPIEEVVKGWKEIPKKAFPREVTVMKDVEFAASTNGKEFHTKVASGGTIYVLDQAGDNLIGAPAPTSQLRAEIALNDTNLKQLLTDGYEQWKPKMVEYQRRQWNFKKMAKDNPVESGITIPMGSGGRPVRGADGTYPLLIASMKSGGVTEITPANVKKWGAVNVEKIDGQEYYTIIVDYTTKTMFGNFDTSAQARIRDGKVVKWVYTGSGEQVP